MGIEILVVSSNIALWNYMDEPDFYTYAHIGDIGEFFHSKQQKIKNKKIKQFMYIDIGEITIFNFKQVLQLDKEIKMLEEEGEFDKGILELIKKGIKMVLENRDLYLKFEY